MDAGWVGGRFGLGAYQRCSGVYGECRPAARLVLCLRHSTESRPKILQFVRREDRLAGDADLATDDTDLAGRRGRDVIYALPDGRASLAAPNMSPP